MPSERRREIIAAASPKPAEGLDKDVIMEVIRSNRNEIKRCYEVPSQETPTLAGMVSVEWRSGPMVR